jgi:predicted ATPase/DNA-binding SARP family transcriptional activator
VAELVLFLFGHPRIECDGRPLDIARRKAVALLAYLGVTRRHHSRDTLATLLFPEDDQTNARSALRRTLSTLVTDIGDTWLASDRETISLNWDADIWVDVAEFRQLLTQAWQPHGHSDSEICNLCVPLLKNAVSLYKDEFLSGFTLRDSSEFDNWQSIQGQNLQRELIDALKRLANGFALENNLKSAIEYAQRWVALDPLEEKAHRLLMLLYARNEQRTAALAQYQKCVGLLDEELGVEPSEETTNLYRAIYTGTLGDPGQTRIFAPRENRLPLPATPFIGRGKELAEIAGLVANQLHRLITLTGPGGIGKTRLALQAAGAATRNFADGTYFVPLAHVNSSHSLGYAVAEALNLGLSDDKVRTQSAAHALEQVRSYLRDRHVLLVIDNFEHIMDGAPLIYEMLQAGPQVKLLITSRERLNLRGETVFTVRGMELPQSAMGQGHKRLSKDPREFDAVKLFVQQAQFGQPDFALTDEDIPFVTGICEQLEGMPLALELAAGWTRALSVREIVGQIDEGLDFLTTSRRDTSERHASLRAVFDHSWKLLSEQERQVFSKMSVFHDGFQKEAAVRVAGATLSLIVALVDKSLLQWNASGRYEIHELLRQYAEEKLDEPAAQQVRELHYDYYARFLRERAVQLRHREDERVLQEIGDEIENLRWMFVWAVQHQTIDELKEPLEYVLRVRATSRSEQLGFAESGIVCQDCGQRNRPGSLFCVNCHAPLLELDDILRLRTKVVTGQAFRDVDRGWGTASFPPGSTFVIQLEDSSEIYQIRIVEINEVVIGRYDPFSGSTPDIDLNPFGGFEKGVSRRHALIARQDNSLHIVDLGSSNGTYLDGQKLTPRQPRAIRDGDEVRIGKLRLYIRFRDALN